jgi:serine protease DegQ
MGGAVRAIAKSLAMVALVAALPVEAATPLPVATGATTIAPMLETVTPAVVNIAVLQRAPQVDNPLLRDPFFRRFFDIPDMPQGRPQAAAGSGVIVDARRGTVITNNHVVEKAEQIQVTLKDGRTFDAKLVGRDPATDIAVLQINADRLTAVRWGDSDRLQVGDFVAAIGNPFGLGQTVTSGIVSALGRTGLTGEGYEDFIQTDASINPGNSGGALVNFQGELVGINTAIIGPSGGSVGIGFAVPVSIVHAVMEQILATGTVQRGRLGVSLQDITPDLAESMRLDNMEGALIAQVQRNSPAERAGLRAGDVVLAVDGKPVRNATDFRNRIGVTTAGTPLELTVLNGGRTRTLTVRPTR